MPGVLNLALFFVFVIIDVSWLSICSYVFPGGEYGVFLHVWKFAHVHGMSLFMAFL